MKFLEKIFDNMVVRVVITLLILGALLFAASFMHSINLPTHEINMIISVNERQTQCAALSCIYYIITPENKWFQVSYDVYPKLQPNRVYNVTVQLPNCNEGIYQIEPSCDNLSGTIISILNEVI